MKVRRARTKRRHTQEGSRLRTERERSLAAPNGRRIRERDDAGRTAKKGRKGRKGRLRLGSRGRRGRHDGRNR